jgi:hypothetical protein
MPRFQSEFGFPSYPGEEELAPFAANPADDLRTQSRFHIARQDLNCPMANSTLEVPGLGTGKKAGCEFPMMSRLLPTPRGGWETQSVGIWRQSLYAGQIAQALCVQAQAEHLRRGRDTAAQTAGSLFWQLNSECKIHIHRALWRVSSAYTAYTQSDRQRYCCRCCVW